MQIQGYIRPVNAAVNLLLISLIALFAVGGTLQYRVASARSSAAPTSRQQAAIATYVVGDFVGPEFGEPSGDGRETLVVALKKGCTQCLKSMEALKQLAIDLKPLSELVVVSPDTAAVTGSFLKEHGLSADRVLSSVRTSDFRLSVTPTLIHLDAPGRGDVPVAVEI